MTDTITKERRSQNMRAIRSKDMRPEMLVRRFVHRLGYRYRLHRTDLPGKPDLAFGPHRKAIFVHGCFWHQHDADHCLDGRRPKSNLEYWEPKLRRNIERDKENRQRLRDIGWDVLVIWECETKNIEQNAMRISSFLERSPTRQSPT